MVRTDVCVRNRCQNADFIESVLFLLLGELAHLDLLEGVDLVVDDAVHVVHAAVGALACSHTGHVRARRLHLPRRLMTLKSLSDMDSHGS